MDVLSRIRVKILGVTVFRFDYQANEVWVDNNLKAVNSTVKENDKETNVSMTSENEVTTLNASSSTSTVPRLFYTSNHWNPAVVGADTVFNTLTGKASKVTIELISDNDEVKGIPAAHYRYTGDIQAETWYDREGRWLKLLFKGKDGSEIEYIID